MEKGCTCRDRKDYMEIYLDRYPSTGRCRARSGPCLLGRTEAPLCVHTQTHIHIILDHVVVEICVQGADDPASLKRLVKERGTQQSINAAMQLAVDASAALVTWYGGLQIATTQSLGSFSLAGEFLVYTLAMYLTINATLDVFSLITVGVMTRKYSNQATQILAAVQRTAGPESGLEVLDKARQAVVTVQVLQALDKLFDVLRRDVDAESRAADFFRDLGAYIVIAQAESSSDFRIDSYKDTERKQIAEIAAEFALADKDDDGYIDAVEFRELGRKTGVDLSSEEAEAAVAVLDTNKDGVVEFLEFVQWFKEKERAS